jgi:hypothetical protein
MRQLFFLSLVVAMIASIVLMVRRPVRLLATIQIILTVLVVVAFAVGMKMALWIHSMAMSDPVRQEWQPRFSIIGAILWFGTIIPWLLFTIYHVIVVIKRRPSA